MFFEDTTTAPKIYIRGANWTEYPALYIVYESDPMPTFFRRARAIVEYEFHGLSYSAATTITATYNVPPYKSASWRRYDKVGHYVVTVHEETIGAWVEDT